MRVLLIALLAAISYAQTGESIGRKLLSTQDKQSALDQESFEECKNFRFFKFAPPETKEEVADNNWAVESVIFQMSGIGIEFQHCKSDTVAGDNKCENTKSSNAAYYEATTKLVAILNLI